MTSSILKPILATGVAVTAAVAIYAEHDRAGRLAAENEALRAQVLQAEAATAELAARMQAPTRERQNEASQADLPRLRGEVTRLRAAETERQTEVLRLRGEVTRLRTVQTEMARTSATAQEAAILNAIGNNLRIIEGAKEQWALENRKTVNDTVTLANLTAYFKNNLVPGSVAGETYSVSTVGVLGQAILPGTLNGKTGPLTTTSF